MRSYLTTRRLVSSSSFPRAPTVHAVWRVQIAAYSNSFGHHPFPRRANSAEGDLLRRKVVIFAMLANLDKIGFHCSAREIASRV